MTDSIKPSSGMRGSNTNDVGIHRFKPRASARIQLWLAAALWATAAIVLAFRGVEWVLAASGAVWMFALGAFLGILKFRFILTPVALRSISRIDARGSDRCAGGFLSWKSWLLVAVMMAGGHALRLTATPRPVLGVLYVTIAVGLSLGAFTFARAAASARC